MNVAPERIVERLVKIYEVERQCTAPGCGDWFRPIQEHQRWCSSYCRKKVSRIEERRREASGRRIGE